MASAFKNEFFIAVREGREIQTSLGPIQYHSHFADGVRFEYNDQAANFKFGRPDIMMGHTFKVEHDDSWRIKLFIPEGVTAVRPGLHIPDAAAKLNTPETKLWRALEQAVLFPPANQKEIGTLIHEVEDLNTMDRVIRGRVGTLIGAFKHRHMISALVEAKKIVHDLHPEFRH